MRKYSKKFLLVLSVLVLLVNGIFYRNVFSEDFPDDNSIDTSETIEIVDNEEKSEEEIHQEEVIIKEEAIEEETINEEDNEELSDDKQEIEIEEIIEENNEDVLKDQEDDTTQLPVATLKKKLGLFTAPTPNGGSIDKFEMYYLNGDAVLEDNQYVLHAERNIGEWISPGTRYSVVYRVDFSFSNNTGGTFAPGEIEIRIPAKIFIDRNGNLPSIKDRNGKDLGQAEMSIPQMGQTGIGDYRYTYDKDNEEFIITNINNIASGQATIDVRYSLPLPSEIKDESFTRDFAGSITLKYPTGNDTDTANGGNVQVDTSHNLLSSTKRVYISNNNDQKFESFPSGWGTPDPKDADNDGDGLADDYFYVVYWIYSRVDYCSQPTKLKIVDTPSNGGEVIAYKSGGRESNASSMSPQGLPQTDPIEFDIPTPSEINQYYYGAFVLVRYPRSAIDPNNPNSYNFINNSATYLTGVDDNITDTKNANTTYKYVPPAGFELPPGYVNARKSTISEKIYGGIDALKNDHEVASRTFENSASVNRFKYTYQEPAGLTTDEEKQAAKKNFANYGKNPVKMEWIDDLLYVRGIFDDPLNSDDYAFTGIELYTSGLQPTGFNKLARNPETLNFETVNLGYDECPDIELWVKIHPSNTWEYYGKYVGNASTRYYDFEYKDGSILQKASNSLMNLPADTYATKLTTDFYYNNATVCYFIRPVIKPTQHVIDLLEKTPYSTTVSSPSFGETAAKVIMNVNTLATYDYNGELIPGSNIAHDSYGNISKYGQEIQDSVYARDETIYKGKAIHAAGEMYLTEFVRGSSLSKTSTYKNDTANKTVRIDYTLTAREGFPFLMEGLSIEEFVEMAAIKDLREGTFYDLLPKGVVFDPSTLVIKPTNNYKSYGDVFDLDYTYELTENYKGTGRTLLTIHVKTPDGVRNYPYKNMSLPSSFYSSFTVTFTGLYSWDDLADYGTTLLNSVVFKADDCHLSRGLPDEGGKITEKDLMYDIDNDGNPAGTPEDYLFAENKTNLVVVTSTELGLTKRVKAADTPDWINGLDGSVVVDANEPYAYRLRIGSEVGTKTANIVFFDSLENYDTGASSKWKGILDSVDVSQPILKGVAPIIYYSTSDTLTDNTCFETATNRDLTDTDLWSTTIPTDKTKITAIAVDLRKKDNGEDFILPELNTLSVIINMKAPDNLDEPIKQGAFANNLTYLSNTLINATGVETPFVISSGKTQVGLPAPVSYTPEVSKTITGDPIKDEDFEFTITAKTAEAPMPENGNTITITGSGTEKFGAITFTRVGKYVYSIKETNSNISGYVYDDSEYLLTVNVTKKDKAYVENHTIKKADGTAVDAISFTNEYHCGDLSVSKTVNGNDADLDKEFNFTIKLSDTSINNTYSNVEFKDGVANITLKHGETTTIEDLPDGITYTVNEDDYTNDGYITSKTGDIGTIKENTPAIAKFTNTKNTYGDLKIEKILQGNDADPDKDFSFTIDLKDTSINDTYSNVTFTDGVANITLKGGQSITIEDLPNATEYEVSEADYSNEKYETTFTNETGTIIGNDSITVKFTNTKNTYGDLKITKTVSGNACDLDKSFEFTITLDDTSINGTYGDVSFTDGVAAFTLKHKESVSIEGLPNGTNYQVEEADYTNDGYITITNNETGTIVGDDLITVDFENIRNSAGSLTVAKIVDGNACDLDKSFEFTITLDDTSINGTYGGVNFVNGKATFLLKSGQSIIFDNLPNGVAYNVTEKDYSADGYVCKYNGNTGVIAENIPMNALFTNTKDTYGNLVVTNTVKGNAADPNKDFNFTVILSDKTINGTYGDVVFTDGVATFTLKHNESKTIKGLPNAVGYTVVEADYTGEGYETLTDGKQVGTIIGGDTVSTLFVNIKNKSNSPTPKPLPPYIPPKTGD